MSRYEIIKQWTLKGKDKEGYYRIWKALSYRLFDEYDQEILIENIQKELTARGVCPHCLQNMKTERYCDGAGDMDTRYICDCLKKGGE